MVHRVGWIKSSLKWRDPEHGGLSWTSQYGDSKGISYGDGVIPDGVFKNGTFATLVDGTKMDVSGMSYKQLVAEGKLEPTHAGTYHVNRAVLGTEYDIRHLGTRVELYCFARDHLIVSLPEISGK